MRRAYVMAVVWVLVAGCLAGDTGWMRSGVRAWYWGGGGGGLTVSDAEEAYLLGEVNGTAVGVTHHAATGHWGMPLPVQESVHDLADQGPFWIHPAVLAQLAPGPATFWQGMEVTLVIRTECTYPTLPCGALLPAVNLFDAEPVRTIVTVNYMMPNFSVGSAYFDAATGLLLQRHALWGYSRIFFILAEINYDFVTRTAFAEPDRPHPGFKSMVSLTSFDGGMIVAHALVESAQGEEVEMRVVINETGAGAFGESRAYDFNACFFGRPPVLRVIAPTEAEGRHPATWDALGEFTWWWIPRSALERAQIQVFGGVMERGAHGPDGAEFTAINQPDGLHLRWAAFDSAGYATGLWMADPSIGMSVGPHNAFNSTLTVDGLDYYRTHMGAAVPGPAVFPPDGFWRDAPDLGGGWRWLDWFGYFNVQQAPRIFHLEHGWLHARGDDPSSVAFYDPAMGSFWWTRDTVYPFLYRFADQQWLLYQRGASPRSFINVQGAP